MKRQGMSSAQLDKEDKHQTGEPKEELLKKKKGRGNNERRENPGKHASTSMPKGDMNFFMET